MEINWVGQEENNGCGIACLAMITGKDYQQVRNEFARFDNSDGLDPFALDSYLADHGYAVARKYEHAEWAHKRFSRTKRETWTPEPFAEVHLAQVQSSTEPPRNHFVVVLSDGHVLDPAIKPHPMILYPLRLYHYSQVWNVAGIVKLCASSI